MKTTCPHCDTEFDAQPEWIGTTMACPFCRESLTVAAAPAADLTDFVDEGPVERTKTCPMCGATVPLSAGECRACGEQLTPFSATTQGQVWRDGKKLVLTKGAELPYRCIKTNAPADRLLKRTLYWYPVWVYVLLISPLIFVIVALIARKSAKVAIPVSGAIRRKRFRALLAAWMCGLGSFGMLIAGFALSDPRSMGDAGLLVGLVGFLGGLIGLVISLNIANLVTPSKITKTHVWLNGAHADYLKPLPEWEA